MYVSRKIFNVLSFCCLFATHISYSIIPLTELKSISSCISPESIDVSPALGALCYTYAKNLSCLGSTDSESVIMLHQLFASEICNNKTSPTTPMIIGHYLEPAHIGQILGILHLHQHNKIDDTQLIRRIKNILKDILNRNVHKIKDEIIETIKQSIVQDNANYLTYEKELINSCSKEERKELQEHLKSLAHTWNSTTENLIINKLNNTQQKNIVSSLKNLHKKIAKNRSLLDLELKSTVIESPLFKDSMGAFVHGLVGSLKEEGSIYPQHNTTHLLLAFLWHKAKNKEDLFDALQAYAKTIGHSQKVCTTTKNSSYTDKDIQQLQSASKDTVLSLPIEDIVYMYHICQQDQNKSPSCTYMTTYFNSFLHALQQPDITSTKKFALPYLVALYAPDWNSVNTLHHTIIYCRCMMQTLDDPNNRLTLMHDISQGLINTTGMVDYYIHALTQLYQSLPITYDLQKKAFDILMYASIHTTPYTDNLRIAKLLIQFIKNASSQDAKAAIACTLLDYMQSDGKISDEDTDFDARTYSISTLRTLKDDTLKALCITHIIKLSVQKNFHANFSDDLTQCILDMLETIQDKDACYQIINAFINAAPENKEPFPLLKTLYTWTIDKLDHMLDDIHKAAIFNQIFDQHTMHIYPENKHSQQLLSHLTQKTLPLIHEEEAITQIIDKALPQLFMQHNIDTELCKDLCDWIKDKLPSLHNESKKVTIITELIKLSENHPTEDKQLQRCIMTTIERTLQSIHQLEPKVTLMKYAVAHDPQSVATKELYTIIYKWVERNIPDINDAKVREDLLFQLLHKVQQIQ